MGATVTNEVRSFPSNSALGQYLRVKMSAGYLVVAGATDQELGVLDQPTFATDGAGSVRMLSGDETVKMVASAAISLSGGQADVYRAAGGKVSSTVSGKRIGIALEAASGDGSIIEVMPIRTEANDVIGVAGGYKIARGEVTLDGSNPTPIATGLTTIVSAAVTLKSATAPGDDPSWASIDYTGSDGTLNLYAWKNTGGTDPTLVASTNNTAVFSWIAIGT